MYLPSGAPGNDVNSLELIFFRETTLPNGVRTLSMTLAHFFLVTCRLKKECVALQLSEYLPESTNCNHCFDDSISLKSSAHRTDENIR